MKKQVLFSFIMVLNVTLLSAQIKVSENGNVGIKSPAGDVLSVLSVNSLGDVNHTVHINSTGKTTGLRVNRYGTVPNSGWGPAVDIQSNLSGSSMIFGLLAYADKDSQTANPLNSGRAFGVCGVAGNSTSGWNFGVVGTVRTTQNGVGIFGADNSIYANGTYIDGRYAGYFKGNVKVTGTINGTTVGNSDIRYKQNIVGLGELSSSGLMTKAASRESKGQNSILNTVLELNPVQYNYKQVYFEPASDTTTVRRGFFNEESQMFQKKHYGLIAQELREIYPDLVYEEDNGYLAVDYTGLIPILIQSIKELNAKVDALETANSDLAKRAQLSVTGSTGVAETPFGEKPAVLYQNTPNPFTQSTGIRYYLPETVTTAALCIYDMQGKQLKQIALTGRGDGTQLISASQLTPGMYLYALIADGQEVDVKRMILTE